MWVYTDIQKQGNKATSKEDNNMTTFQIEYIKTGSGELKTTDRVSISEGEEFEFETGTEKVESITDAILVFEMIAEKWWGTYENRHAIVNIKAIAA